MLVKGVPPWQHPKVPVVPINLKHQVYIGLHLEQGGGVKWLLNHPHKIFRGLIQTTFTRAKMA